MHQDMRGYLRIRNVLSTEEVAELNAAFDLMEDMDQVCDSDTVNPYGGGMDGHERGSLRGMLDWPDEVARPFRNLIADERLTPYLNTLFGPGWHLADQPFLSVQENGSGGQVPCTTLSCSVLLAQRFTELCLRASTVSRPADTPRGPTFTSATTVRGLALADAPPPPFFRADSQTCAARRDPHGDGRLQLPANRHPPGRRRICSTSRLSQSVSVLSRGGGGGSQAPISLAYLAPIANPASMPSNFYCPEPIALYDTDHEAVYPVEADAGDCIIFL